MVDFGNKIILEEVMTKKELKRFQRYDLFGCRVITLTNIKLFRKKVKQAIKLKLYENHWKNSDGSYTLILLRS